MLVDEESAMASGVLQVGYTAGKRWYGWRTSASAAPPPRKRKRRPAAPKAATPKRPPIRPSQIARIRNYVAGRARLR